MASVQELEVKVRGLEATCAELVRRLTFVMSCIQRVEQSKLIGGEARQVSLLDFYLESVEKAAKESALVAG